MRRLFAVVPLLFVLAAVEAMLRLWYPVVPSLAGLRADKGAPASAIGARFGACATVALPPPTERSGRIVALGDSVTAGAGVQRPQAWPTVLGTAMGVNIANVAEPGAELCRELDMLQEEILTYGWPKALIWQVFGDDLGPYLVYSKDGRFVMFPEAERNALLRFLMQRSYLFNLALFELRLHQGHGTNRVLDPELRIRMRTRLKELAEALRTAEVIVVPFLLEPVGIDNCPPDGDAADACVWMKQDLHALEGLFRTVGLQPLDFRGLWRGRQDHSLAFERAEAWRGGLTIHPDAAGQAVIATALLPHVQDRLTGDEAPATR